MSVCRCTSTCTLWGGETKRKSDGESVHCAEKLGTHTTCMLAQSQFKDLTSSIACRTEALKEELSAASTCTLWGGKTKKKSAGESTARRSLGHYLRAQSLQFKDLTSSIACRTEAPERGSVTSTCVGRETKRMSVGECTARSSLGHTLPAGTKPISLKASHHSSLGGERARRGKEEALGNLP